MKNTNSYAPKRDAYCEINLGQIKKNYLKIKKKVAPADVICIVKADAYGHGAKIVSKMLEEEGAKFFGVGTLTEAKELRDEGIKSQIILLSPPPLDYISEIIKLNTVVIISSEIEAEKISKYISKTKNKSKKKFLNYKLDCFLGIDTGMSRIGFLISEISQMKTVLSNKNLNFIGLFSHLSSADKKSKSDRLFTETQIKRFETLDKMLNFPFEIKTIANSGGIKYYKNSYFNAVRPGLALYEGAMSIKTKIVQIKTIEKGTSVGYGREFIAKKKTIVGVLPIGYADGVYRSSKNAFVLVNRKKARILGAVCMDMLMVDLTNIKNVSIYDKVVLLGKQGTAKITATTLAKLANTISYEVLCRFGERLSKIYLEE